MIRSSRNIDVEIDSMETDSCDLYDDSWGPESTREKVILERRPERYARLAICTVDPDLCLVEPPQFGPGELEEVYEHGYLPSFLASDT
jgi:hypothetical protein